ncbi:MAG TPA: hypothetical protein DDZ36_09885 [Deltaproteobacteria bacterium]|nr:hypothetical protein [Deltaproteobacteria bacterium]
MDIVKLLLELGAKVESRNRWKETALLLAASKGFREIVLLLIQSGADFSAEDVNEKTALLRAAQNGHLFVVETLLAQGANLHVNTFDLNGKGGTALIQAARNGHREVLPALLNAGAKIDESEMMFHHSALMVAALNGHEKTVEFLLNAGADFTLKDTSERSALLLAATNNHQSIIILLLDAEQTGDKTDSNGNGIWHLMAMSDVENEDSQTLYGSGQKEERASTQMYELISRGIVLDKLNDNGETALMIAVKRRKMKLIINLLELGASRNILTPDGESALTFAEASGNDELVKLLR